MNHADRTVPYRLSPAELENLRILRRRTNPAGPNQDNEQREEMDTQKSDLDRSNLKTEKKISREQP